MCPFRCALGSCSKNDPAPDCSGANKRIAQTPDSPQNEAHSNERTPLLISALLDQCSRRDKNSSVSTGKFIASASAFSAARGFGVRPSDRRVG